ncbi:response regulator [Synoicihabitans lomoniglobus]|uniref:histidine kinase n=1 Tax=Synoicihabitans lomoniglobus TaxID=2909285 RepID=A0AAE9ZXV3_9BACT|nr:response regulator [Opitutaceae bacterium LMO-M01]WED63208.1 response regulator [Opitutaceae bacterium LMO-M01]
MTSQPSRILVVDDTPNIHGDFRKILTPKRPSPADETDLEAEFFDEVADELPSHRQFAITSAYQGQEALLAVKESIEASDPFQVAFVDMRMPPGWDGLETIRHIWAVDPNIQVVICTAYSDYTWKNLHDELGPSDSLIILKKPFDNIEVVQLAHALTRKWELDREHRNKVEVLGKTVKFRTGQLQAARDRFAEAFNASPLAQCIQSLTTGEVLEVNAAYVSCLGLHGEEVVGRTPESFSEHVSPRAWRRLMRKLARGETIADQLGRFTRPDGEHREFRIFARRIVIQKEPHCLWVMQDTTDRTMLERQLQQAQKMEAIGQLAAGVAHDFNNIMTVMQGFTQVNLAHPDLPPDLRQNLEHVNDAGTQAAALTRQLLLFSRKQVTQERLLAPADVVRDLEPLLRRLLGSGFELQLQLENVDAQVRADRANLEQILMNLVGNARDALGQHGHIEVKVCTVSVSADDTARVTDASEGQFVRIDVSDDGPGIPPNVLPRIFDPFFTTKPVGEGTGLGLATCYGIARQHGGWIEVKTTPGRGTIFQVFLPVEQTGGSKVSATLEEQNGLTNTTHLRGTERILIAEDDAVVTELIGSVLRRHGYATTCVDNGPAALRAWDEMGGFDMVFSDMVMPKGMNGAELATEILKTAPDVPIVLATGYSEALLQEVASPELLEHCVLLLKPYDMGKLLRIVRQVFDAKKSGIPWVVRKTSSTAHPFPFSEKS